LLWTTAAGLGFSVLNALARQLTLHVDPFQSQFLRYAFGLMVLLPVILRRGAANYLPRSVRAQFARGAVHTLGLLLWYLALPRIPLADMTAIGFTTPLFVMIGAGFFFKEPMHWERWLATLVGFAGVLVVVGPRLSGSGGQWHLVMLASAPIFATSFLLTKALTRRESAGVILVWQALTVSLFSLPLALTVWQWPTAWEWAGFAFCGLLGSAAHYALTRSFQVADISATQSAKFLDLMWAALLGWLVFSDVPSGATLAGGMLISAATVWVAHRESRRV
jgi:drug/metabolite transporter (DMT)-like permease